MSQFSKAIVRTPCKNMIHGLSEAGLGKPDYEKALIQHNDYINALKSCGLQVTILPPDEKFPDSTFIEDVALCTPHCAIITNPGAPSRKGETEGMEEVLRQYYDSIYEIKPPGTLDAGDVMMVENHYYIGLSGRTNRNGADQLIEFLQNHGMNGTAIFIQEALHLKSAVAYLGENTLAASGLMAQQKVFKSFRLLQIPPSESYAANCVRINDRVLIPAGFPAAEKLVRETGYKTIRIDVSEFRKLDGGISCLSLRF